jgi:cytochrome bd-type quinol oxidase subunit 1
MGGKKILVMIIALVLLLACVIALRLRRDNPVGPSMSETSRLIGGPAFEVQVEMPAFNSGRAPWEIPGVIFGYDHGRRRLGSFN